MNTYKYKIHYNKFDLQKGGSQVVISQQPQFFNLATQQQVALATQGAQQQLVLQQQALQKEQQKPQQQNNSDAISLQVYTLNQLYLRVRENNDLAIYMLDYINQEKEFFKQNDTLTVDNNKYCKRILIKCLEASNTYSKIGSPYWLRVLQFLKYVSKDGDMPKAINTTFIKIISNEKINIFKDLLENIITIKSKVMCNTKLNKVNCGHTKTQKECIDQIIK